MFLDFIIVQYLYNLAISYSAIELLAIFCASVLIWIIAAWYIIAFIRRHRGGIVELATLLIGTAMAYGFNTVIGWHWFRLRPFAELQWEPLINVSYWSKSFPSDHATLAFLLAYLLSVYNKNWRWPVLFLAVLVGIGRIAVGVHYPTDVLGGAVIGLVFGWAIEELKKILPNIGQ